VNSKEIRSVIDSLRTMIQNIVDEKINALPLTLPAKVLSRDGVTVSAVPILSFGSLPPPRIDGVPILKSKYINEPVKEGDFGLLVPASFFFQEMITKDKEEIETAIPTITSGNYMFCPLSQEGYDFSDGIDTELWSADGNKYVRVKNNQIELGGSTGFATEYTALNTAIQAFVNAINLHVHTSAAPGSPTSVPVTPMSIDLSGSKVEGVRV
jgi:hypothetical protein